MVVEHHRLFFLRLGLHRSLRLLLRAVRADLWAGPLWRCAQGSGHQSTQQQLMRLRILQHHELQQVFLDAARLRQRRWDSPRKRLQDGHPGRRGGRLRWDASL